MIPETLEGTVDEADGLEQRSSVPGGDEHDYPHTPSTAALAELVERLSRQRLADRISPDGDPAASANGAPSPP